MSTPRRPRAFVMKDTKEGQKGAGKPSTASGATADSAKMAARAPQALPAGADIREEAPPVPCATGAGNMTRAEGGLRRAFRWGRVLALSLSGLLAMWATSALYGMIEALFARAPALGWAAITLAMLAALAVLAIALRELFGLMRLRRITALHEEAALALESNDEEKMGKVLKRLENIYSGRSDTRWALERLKEHETAIMTPAERLDLAERELLAPLDAEASRIIAATSRQVAVMTALIPVATLDMALVALRNLAMLRRLAALYGGRPGLFGGLKLARMVMTHIALTGSLALTDTFVQNILGKGLAGRLSARFGEGAVNGILTARVGIATLGVVRPLPFRAVPAPRLKDYAARLFDREEEKPN